jgi:hypothetical protein
MQAARGGTDTEEADLKIFLATLRSQIDDFAGEAPQFDDMTMLCVEYRGSAADLETKE